MPQPPIKSSRGEVIEGWHLNYPLELLTKTADILLRHPGDARARLHAAWIEFHHLSNLDLPEECERERNSIIEEYLKHPRMRINTAARLIERIVVLHDNLEAIRIRTAS
jgi:hypothetical protein